MMPTVSASPNVSDRPTCLIAVSNGDILALEDRSDQIVLVDPVVASAGTHRLLLLLDVPSFPEVCLASAAGDRDVLIGFRGSPERLTAFPLRLCRVGPSGRVALRHMINERFVCAPPRGRSGSHVEVTIDRDTAGEWELFDLRKNETSSTLAGRLRTAMRDAPLAAGECVDPLEIARWLRQAPIETAAYLLPLLFGLASSSARRDLGHCLIREPELLAKLCDAFPHDKWAAETLPELAGWRQGRFTREIVAVAQAHQPRDTSSMAVTEHLVVAARASIRPTRSIAVLASARNEGSYLIDWVAFHRAIGVDHFFIYSNDNEDGSDLLLDRLASHGVITHLPQRLDRTVSAQSHAYGHALSRLPELTNFEWVATIDLDEYIVLDPEQFDGLPAFLRLASARNADAVVLNWRQFTPGGCLDLDQRPVIERLVMREPSLNHHVKTIFRPHVAAQTTCHAPIWSAHATGRALDSLGVLHHGIERAVWDRQFRVADDAGPAWINHYCLRSLPEFIWKISRNRGSSTSRNLQADGLSPLIPFFIEWFDSRLAIPDHSALAWLDRFQAERRALLALDGVGKIHEAALDAFRRMVALLQRDLLAQNHVLSPPWREAMTPLLRASIQMPGMRAASTAAGAIVPVG